LKSGESVNFLKSLISKKLFNKGIVMELSIQLEKNENFTQFPIIVIGDTVFLRFTKGFQYFIKAVVTQNSQGQIKAVVEKIFDGTGHGTVNAGDVLNMIGCTLVFDQDFIHMVTSCKSTT
jgi:hypothetical protein